MIEKISKYIPFDKIKGFYKLNLLKNNFLFFTKNNICLLFKIFNGNSFPKTGLLICKEIENFTKGKNVLEIGTGESGIISIFSSIFGAKKIVASDIKKSSILKAKYNAKINNIKNILFIRSNLFENIKGKFDIIISNPPQMPMRRIGTCHDYGGRNGRKYIIEIIKSSKKYLNKKGIVLLAVFDFLGVNKRFNNKESLFEIAKKYGFTPKIINTTERVIRNNGETMKNMKFIEKQYPLFNFSKEKNKFYHKIFIVILRKNY
jgi:release factor glutamine methyltransferase